MAERRPLRRDAEANRERILAAAEAVFGAQGAEGSTEEVAGRAGVGIATVFRHFPTKEGLIEAALVRHFAGLQQEVAAIADRADAGEAVRTMVTTMIETGASKITLAGLLLENGELPDDVRASAAELRRLVGDVLGHAQAAGAVRADVGVDELYLLIRGLTHARTTMVESPETVRLAVDVVVRGIGAG